MALLLERFSRMQTFRPKF
uniref:Uncharacterized protein n=1 Tax=Arundo donax TaxID=35708 RepID=A0A0A9FYR7_ARUDO